MPPRFMDKGRIAQSWWIAVAVAVVLAVTLAGGLGSRAKLTGDSPKDRIDCIIKLADEQPWGAAGVLAKAVAEEPNVQVRRAALVALKRFADDDCRGVVDAATEDTDADVRAAAATMLGRYDDPAAVDRLLVMAAEDAAPAVRAEAVDALADVDDTKVTDGLLDVMEHDRDFGVRRRAMHVLSARRGLRFSVMPDPTNPAQWREALRTIRTFAGPPKRAPAGGQQKEN